MLEGVGVSERRSCGMHANDQRQRAWHLSDGVRADAHGWVMLTLVSCACAAVSGAVSALQSGPTRALEAWPGWLCGACTSGSPQASKPPGRIRRPRRREMQVAELLQLTCTTITPAKRSQSVEAGGGTTQGVLGAG
jgi:hypothetical protein